MFKKIPERSYLLEISKISGMFIWFLISSLNWIAANYGIPIGKILLMQLLDSIAGYLAISLLFILLNYVVIKKALPKKLFAYMLIPLCCLFALMWDIASNFLFSVYYEKEISLFNKHFFANFIYFLTPLFAFTGLYYIINHWLNLKKQKELTLTATNLANETQLQMLRYQINPHFLFNSLNTIRAMIEEDKNIARKMVTELSDFFRYSLSHNGTVDTFENEINAIKNYLEIQKIRFEEKLIVVYDIDEKLNNLKIPFFIILPLVENAIKFGTQTSNKPLTIKICAKINSNLEISIRNTGKLVENFKSTEGTRTGIQNTKKRLALYFQDNYSFNLFEENSWVISQIIIRNFKNQFSE
ncbi:MAG: histidine kinase [Salinivirgaceae bacterium]|nr:histidine kinase [Salinivirgaceae bacterium]